MNVNGYEIGPGANLEGANLTYTNLEGANLTHANLKGANLADAGPPTAEKAVYWGIAIPSWRDTAAIDEREALRKLKSAKLTGATMPDGSIHK